MTIYNFNTGSINDNANNSFNTVIPLPALSSVQKIKIFMNIRHTFLADLSITITHPTGTPRILFQRFGYGTDDWSGTISDFATNAITDDDVINDVVGEFLPFDGLKIINSATNFGVWVLNINDVIDVEVGTFVSGYIEVIEEIDNIVPCFSHDTLLKIVRLQKSLNSKQKLYLMTRTKRNDKNMYRCDYGNYGNLEFTSDHPFLYKNKLVDFENLAKNHLIIKKTAKCIPLDDETCGSESMIYNIYGHYEQLHKNNQFELGPNLVMIGGKFTSDNDTYNKIKERMNTLETEMKTNNDLLEKYSLANFIGNTICDSNELYIVAI